ncbi:hypothetical protein KXD93_19395 [Mucilaginibacter sp. BJC16-A38]|uniref:hypothetical protein n=1 Tax=Mucilaginibacter phenanthrenivorans TaxID=1234842 RepID=UPI0021575465|nr:hypothetical protein [Mucilaginibacter phenanthrenivorans]MCR8559824.1 hypothetical protein [Mucilaginibacter phenanthrenivorans]
MEKATYPKRYNLKPPVDPSKPKLPAQKCPECKSRNIKVMSRRRYLLKSAVCTIVVLPYWLLLLNLKDDDIPGPPAGIMLLAFLAFTIPVAVYGVYFLVRALLIKQTNYRCRHCKNKFYIPLLELSR